jgi:hypothetical protein
MGVSSLSGTHVDVVGTSARTVKFAEVDALPSAEERSAVLDENGLGCSEGACLEVGGAVAFCVEEFSAVGIGVAKSEEDVVDDIGVRVFVDGDGSCGVRTVHSADAVFYAALFDAVGNGARDVFHLFSLRFDGQSVSHGDAPLLSSVVCFKHSIPHRIRYRLVSTE